MEIIYGIPKDETIFEVELKEMKRREKGSNRYF
jgi:hypothetical protein